MSGYNSNESLENNMTDEYTSTLDESNALNDNLSEESSPEERWIQKNPTYRQTEISFIKDANLDYPYTFTQGGDLQQPFNVSGWTFLLVLDRSYPRETEQGEIPIKVYLVNPGVVEFKKLYNIESKNIPYVQVDSSGMYYLEIDEVSKAFAKYSNNQHNMCMVETMLKYTNKWVNTLQQAIEQEKIQQKKKKRSFVDFFMPSRQINRNDDEYYRRNNRAKYVDGRASCSDYVNPRCQKVVLSNRAFIQIFNESQSKIETETGGLLLGHYEHGVWYVIEASDPGINAVFRVAYHEGDDVYQNHVCDVISRTYKYPLVFLGMWHRHPGSLDSFSGTDDGTNYKYAASVGNGCISAIINYDPNFRITFYFAEQDNNGSVKYTKVDVEVGDDRIPNKNMMMLADMSDVISRMN